ncbi:MAG: HD domain-containing protein [Sphingobacteriales bacterium]|nr:MAG: HD domain-containing protein [Sphingobacteriales bacterium]
MSNYHHEKRIGSARYRSVALLAYPRRRDYIRHLIRRLDHVPQILPVSFSATARTRGMHCRNMAAIAAKIKLGAHEAGLRRSLTTAAMVHDIGHAAHGHAAERAINEWIGENVFSNDQHSSRVLYFHSPRERFAVPMFSTPAFPSLPDLSYVRSSSAMAPISSLGVIPTVKSETLEFLDDLENTVGDCGDLMRNGLGQVKVFYQDLCPKAKKGFAIEHGVDLALELMHRFGFDGSYRSFESLAAPTSEVRRLMQMARTSVHMLRMQSKLIQHHDADAHDQTLDMCEWASTLRLYDGVVDRQWVVDVVSAIDIEAVK